MDILAHLVGEIFRWVLFSPFEAIISAMHPVTDPDAKRYQRIIRWLIGIAAGSLLASAALFFLPPTRYVALGLAAAVFLLLGIASWFGRAIME